MYLLEEDDSAMIDKSQKQKKSSSEQKLPMKSRHSTIKLTLQQVKRDLQQIFFMPLVMKFPRLWVLNKQEEKVMK